MATTSTNSSLTFYPSYVFSESPTYDSLARLTASDIQTNLYRRPEYAGVPDLYFFTGSNHPIRWVQVVGTVVAFDEYEQRTVFTLDDGSGSCLDVLLWTSNAKPGLDTAGVRLYAVIKARGVITEFRGARQMVLRAKVEVVSNTMDEVKCWRKMVLWKREVLMVPWSVDKKTLRRARRERERGVKDEEREGRRKKRRRKEGVPAPTLLEETLLEDTLLEETQPPAKKKRAPDNRRSPEVYTGKVDLYADLDFGTKPPAPTKRSARVIHDDYSDLDFDRDTSRRPAVVGVLGTTRKNKSSTLLGREKPVDRAPSPLPKRPRSPSPEFPHINKRMKRDLYEDLEFDTQRTRSDARSTLKDVWKISGTTSGNRSERTVQSDKVEAPQTKPRLAVQHDPQTLRFSRPVDDPPAAAPRLPAMLPALTQDPPVYPGGPRRKVSPVGISGSQQSVSRSLEVRMSQPGASSKRERRSMATESSLPPSSIAAQSSYPYDDLSAIISTYQPTPEPPCDDLSTIISAHQPASTPTPSQTSRRSRCQEIETSSQSTQPSTQPPDSPRPLKYLILSHLRSTSAITTTLASLTKSLHATPSDLSPALEALSSDGYIIPSSDGWYVVGYPLLRDIIDTEVRAAQKRKTVKKLLVGKVLRKAGKLWPGIGKEATKDVLAEWFKEREGWVEVSGGWEWTGGG